MPTLTSCADDVHITVDCLLLCERQQLPCAMHLHLQAGHGQACMYWDWSQNLL